MRRRIVEVWSRRVAEAKSLQRSRFLPLGVGLFYVLLSALALKSTLHSLAHDDIDGLNFLDQYPLAWPWLFLLHLLPPQAPRSIAWSLAGVSLINALILYGVTRWWQREGVRAKSSMSVPPS